MIRWRDGDGRLYQGSLFAALAALACGDAWSFPALRPHQREPWHAFTVQVAALALIQAGIDQLPADETSWRDLLIGLTPEQPNGEAWALVMDDWSKPALLQPPVLVEANRASYKTKAEDVLQTPDALDMLVTSRNHDVKQERIGQASDEDWLFALVTLQTMEGIMGAGRYGISRMFGGYGNRMSLGVRPVRGGASAVFKRDVRRVVSDARSRPDRRHGTALLWTIPWDGEVSLDVEKLDELYVEICRRVRLRRSGSDLQALTAGSKCSRVAGEELGGNTKDPWMPLTIDTKKDRKTFGKLVGVTPSSAGFGYRQMANLLDRQKITAPLLALLHPEDDRTDIAFVASALVRGQGKTEGLHRRVVRTSRIEQLEDFGEATVLDRVGNAAKRRSEEASEAGRRLRRALILLVQGGPNQARLDDDSASRKVEPWVRRFDRLVDREFFDDPLWAEALEQAAAADHRRVWRERLRALAGTVFDEAAKEAPRTEMRRVRAIVQARSMLDGQMIKWLREIAA
jgi:CRISPR system Cascade subunit CasA